MKSTTLLLLSALLIVACSKTEQQQQPASTSSLEARVDSLMHTYLDSTKAAGVAVAVVKGNEKLLLKSYGYADLEFKVKLPVDASFEIGSVTKQFTAAAIMQLVEQGKLSLEDDISKYITFNTHGKKVTVRQLLSHTSGIKGYTELPMFESVSVHKYKRDTLLKIVEKEKFDFEPGEALIYNNTGFFMLGLIIEKISGLSYEEYVAKNLFEKAGMTNSYYCSENKVIENRAHGYDTGDKGLQRAGYLDHTWPYAAGSLCSTVEDLVKWDDALHHGKILNDKTYEEFITPVSLIDGTVTHYAKGITVTDKYGHTMIEHGGGINGFLSENRYFPKEDLKIVVLINSTGPVSPAKVADEITQFIFGKPTVEPHYFTGDIAKYTGTYKGRGRGEDLTVTIAKTDSGLVIQPKEGKAKALHYIKDNSWENNGATYLFSGTGDSMTELRIDQTYGFYILKKEK